VAVALLLLLLHAHLLGPNGPGLGKGWLELPFVERMVGLNGFLSSVLIVFFCQITLAWTIIVKEMGKMAIAKSAEEG
jgi:hypothetical protein